MKPLPTCALLGAGLLATACGDATPPRDARGVRAPHVEQWSIDQYEQAKIQGPTAVMFTATWCGPCRAAHPIFLKLSGSYPSVRFGEVDVDTYPRSLVAVYPKSRDEGGTGIPEFRLNANGREDRRIGISYSDEEDLRDLSRRLDAILRK